MNDEFREEYFEHADSLRKHMQMVLVEVQAFVEYNCKFDHKDFESDLKAFKRVTDTVKAMTDYIKIDKERKKTKRTVQLSELAMSESRSAIACKHSLEVAPNN